MAPRQEAPARPPRRAALGLVALMLLALVAIGSAGDTQFGLGGRRPSYLLVDTIVSLLLVVLVLGALVGIYAVYSERDYLAAQRRSKGRKRPLLAVGIALVLTALVFSVRGVVRQHANRQLPTLAHPPGAAGATTKATSAYEPHFAAAPVLLVVGIVGSAAFAAYLAYRSRRSPLTASDDERSLALSLADVLGDTLDDLRAEPDARRAVIAAYARLERTLGAFGLPRRPNEAPDEYLHRILADLEVGSRSARRLTQLFAHAKFSQHDVDQPMKSEAIQLLETIRTDLRDADARAQAERETSETSPPRAAW